MMEDRTGGQAFPWNGQGNWKPLFDMTLRDYMAAAALQGMLAHHGQPGKDYDLSAKIAYKQADAMLEERKKCS